MGAEPKMGTGAPSCSRIEEKERRDEFWSHHL